MGVGVGVVEEVGRGGRGALLRGHLLEAHLEEDVAEHRAHLHQGVERAARRRLPRRLEVERLEGLVPPCALDQHLVRQVGHRLDAPRAEHRARAHLETLDGHRLRHRREVALGGCEPRRRWAGAAAGRGGSGQGRQRAGAARSRGEGGKGWGGAPHRDQVALLEQSEGVGRDGGLLITGCLDRLQLLLHRVHDRRHRALDHLGAVLLGHLEPLVLHGFGQAHLGSRTSGRGQLVLRNAARRWHQREHRRLGAAPAGHRLALGGETHHVLRQVCTRDEVVGG